MEFSANTHLLLVRMNMDADVCFGAVRTLGQISRLVDNLGASAEVARFDLIMHLAFANNIVLQIKTDKKIK